MNNNYGLPLGLAGMVDESSKLSDLVDIEEANEIAMRHRPEEFKWEANGKTSLSTAPKWIIEAMIEFRNKSVE